MSFFFKSKSKSVKPSEPSPPELPDPGYCTECAASRAKAKTRARENEKRFRAQGGERFPSRTCQGVDCTATLKSDPPADSLCEACVNRYACCPYCARLLDNVSEKAPIKQEQQMVKKKTATPDPGYCNACAQDRAEAKEEARANEQRYMDCGGENFPRDECQVQDCTAYVPGDPPADTACAKCAERFHCCPYCLRLLDDASKTAPSKFMMM